MSGPLGCRGRRVKIGQRERIGRGFREGKTGADSQIGADVDQLTGCDGSPCRVVIHWFGGDEDVRGGGEVLTAGMDAAAPGL